MEHANSLKVQAHANCVRSHHRSGPLFKTMTANCCFSPEIFNPYNGIYQGRIANTAGSKRVSLGRPSKCMLRDPCECPPPLKTTVSDPMNVDEKGRQNVAISFNVHDFYAFRTSRRGSWIRHRSSFVRTSGRAPAPPPPFEIGTHEDGRARARTRARIPRQVFAFVPPYANSTKLCLSPTNYNGNPESVRKGTPT